MPMNPQTEMGHEQKGRVSLGFGNLTALPGNHIAHFYQTAEEWKDLLVSYHKAGLEAGDHIGHFYRTSEEEKNVLIPFFPRFTIKKS